MIFDSLCSWLRTENEDGGGESSSLFLHWLEGVVALSFLFSLCTTKHISIIVTEDHAEDLRTHTERWIFWVAWSLTMVETGEVWLSILEEKDQAQYALE